MFPKTWLFLERAYFSTTLDDRGFALIFICHLGWTVEHLRLTFKCFGRAVRNSQEIQSCHNCGENNGHCGPEQVHGAGNTQEMSCVTSRPDQGPLGQILWLVPAGVLAGGRPTERDCELLRPAQPHTAAWPGQKVV